MKRRTLRIMEALGYAAAILVGMTGATVRKTLEPFNMLALAFAIVTIVRLLVINVAVEASHRWFVRPHSPPRPRLSETPDRPPHRN